MVISTDIFAHIFTMAIFEREEGLTEHDQTCCWLEDFNPILPTLSDVSMPGELSKHLCHQLTCVLTICCGDRRAFRLLAMVCRVFASSVRAPFTLLSNTRLILNLMRRIMNHEADLRRIVEGSKVSTYFYYSPNASRIHSIFCIFSVGRIIWFAKFPLILLLGSSIKYDLLFSHLNWRNFQIRCQPFLDLQGWLCKIPHW